MAQFLTIDFESSSKCDLKKSGAWVYSLHPSTEIICLAYHYAPTDEAGVWTPDDLEPLRWIDDPEVVLVAHNVGFEKAIWRNILVPKFGWPDVPNERWHDTMAVCAMKQLPQKLELAARFLHLPVQKDMEGSRLTLSFSQVNKKTGEFKVQRTADKLARIYSYCKEDVRAEVLLHKRVKGLGPEERKVWLLDQTINERGVKVDMDFVAAGLIVCDQASVPLVKEFEKLTGVKPSQRDAFLKWLVDAGARLPDLKKETIDKVLGAEDDDELDTDDETDGTEADIFVPQHGRRALEIRRIVSSASIKKLQRMQFCAGPDHVVRGLLQYHGAGTGRWAGRLLQPQNFPRGTLDLTGEGPGPDVVVEVIKSRDAAFVQDVLGEPVAAVASGLRHALVARPGKEFVSVDFKTIEARIVLAAAGQHDKVAIMAAGQDIYLDMAALVFGRPCTKADKKERHTGKNAVLGCGFGLGKKTFQTKYAPDEDIDFADRAVTAYRKEFAPLVPKMWYGLEDAAVKAVWDQRPVEFLHFRYEMEDGFLTCRLPNGRKLYYFAPQRERRPAPWDPDDIRCGFSYMAVKQGKVKRINAYGGLLTENVVQAMARDLLVEAMFKCEQENLPIVLTVHDELVAEADKRGDNLAKMLQIVRDTPAWAKSIGIPVDGEGWTGGRYRK